MSKVIRLCFGPAIHAVSLCCFSFRPRLNIPIFSADFRNEKDFVSSNCLSLWAPEFDNHSYDYRPFRPNLDFTKGPGKRGHIVADTLLPMMFLGLRKLGNICCGHKMFLNKISKIFCVPDTDTEFVRNKCYAWGQTGKRLCRQQCVRNNVSSFARALSLITIVNYNSPSV